VGSPADSGQTLQATLRVPSSQLDATMAEVRKLGRVESEQQGSEEVTQQVVDLEARLANARNTEERLADILRRSTGKITDVLAVEKEMDRVRGEIERMQAERKGLGDRIDFATLEVHVNEEYKAHLEAAAPSAFGRMRNAAVAGYRNVEDSLTGAAIFVLRDGPWLLVWGALLFLPVRYAWRRTRKAERD
jgi:chromosome segregation ATPase